MTGATTQNIGVVNYAVAFPYHLPFHNRLALLSWVEILTDCLKSNCVKAVWLIDSGLVHIAATPLNFVHMTMQGLKPILRLSHKPTIVQKYFGGGTHVYQDIGLQLIPTITNIPLLALQQ